MKREIKFRAWNPKEDFMHVAFNITSHGEVFNYTEDLSHLILMQYTGLKDKNGKEIYEGDIVRWSIGIREVFYHKSMFAIKYNENIVMPTSHEEGEVIGNIHENPELLTQ